MPCSADDHIDYTITGIPGTSSAGAAIRRRPDGTWMPITADCQFYTPKELREMGVYCPDTGFASPESYKHAMRQAGLGIEQEV